jgi:hypothetical protein
MIDSLPDQMHLAPEIYENSLLWLLKNNPNKLVKYIRIWRKIRYNRLLLVHAAEEQLERSEDRFVMIALSDL